MSRGRPKRTVEPDPFDQETFPFPGRQEKLVGPMPPRRRSTAKPAPPAPAEPDGFLEIERPELVKALGLLSRTVGSRRLTHAEMVLLFADGQLHFRAAGAEVSAPASGSWPGEACVAAAWILGLRRLTRERATVRIEVRDGRIRVPPSSVRCDWSPRGSASVVLPMDASLTETLRVALRHSPETLRASGLGVPTGAALSRLEDMIRAATAAFEPIELPEGEIRAMAHRSIAEASQGLAVLASGTRLSADTSYQLSNRLAFTWKLASLGIPTVLVYLGFTGV